MTLRQSHAHRVSRRDFLRFAGAATGGLIAAGACGPAVAPSPTVAQATAVPAAPTSSPRRGGLLRIAFPTTASQFDPALAFSDADFNVAYSTHDGLTKVGIDLKAYPVLAESWSISDDLLSWDFNLKQGITFLHGTPFTAEDVVFTFKRILDPGLGSPIRSVLSFVEDVQSVDDHSVRFVLKTPNADLPLQLGAPQANIVPHDRTDSQLAQEPSGTGPFILDDFEPETRVVMVRREDHWEEGVGLLDEVRHLYMTEQATQIAALTGGQVDLMVHVAFENIAEVDAHPQAAVVQARSGLYQPLVMRVTMEPFTDVRVRQAMKLVVDREGVRQVVLQGVGDLGNDQPIPPIDRFWADLPIPDQNIEKARELLAEAGYPDGLDVTLHTGDIRPGWIAQAVAFQEMAKDAGIRVELKRVPADVYWSEVWTKVPLCMSNWNLRASTDEQLSIAYHSSANWNETDFQSDELDSLIEQGRAATDHAERAQIYAEAQRLLKEEGGVVVAFFKPIVSAIRSNVQGYEAHPSGWVKVDRTWIG